MNRRYINYSRKKFNDWRDKVKKHLPSFVIRFYNIEKFVDYEKHRLLGRVITGINDPYYSIIGCDGKHLDRESEIANECLLEIMTTELFSFISKN